MAQRPARADVLDDILGAAPAPKRRPTARQDIRPTRSLVPTKPTEPNEPGESDKPGEFNKPKSYGRRARMNVEIPEGLAAEVRDAVIALSGPPVRLTLVRFAEEAFRREIARLQAEHHGGKSFPATDRVVRVGRPIRAAPH